MNSGLLEYILFMNIKNKISLCDSGRRTERSEVRQRRGYYMQGIAKQNGSSTQLGNAIDRDGLGILNIHKI